MRPMMVKIQKILTSFVVGGCIYSPSLRLTQVVQKKESSRPIMMYPLDLIHLTKAKLHY